jgi:ABC-type antimicrobial peptide transport system permease subunit
MGQGWMRVIGVVEAVAHAGLTDDPVPGRYLLMDQFDYVPASGVFVLRALGGADLNTLLPQAVRTIQRTSPELAVDETTTMTSVLARAMGATHRIMQLMTMLGALALALGAVGVYGVVSYFVSRRRRDWVIKIALGLHPGTVLRQVVARGALLVAIGCVLGVVASIALIRLISSLLYGVSAADPGAIVAAAATLIAAGCLAALLPGRRASRANPAQVLRES